MYSKFGKKHDKNLIFKNKRESKNWLQTVWEQTVSNLAFQILIFVEALGTKKIGHIFKWVIFWFVQKIFLNY